MKNIIKKKKVLVTGGSGFIGTNLVNYFLKQGLEIINFDQQPPRDSKCLSAWVEGDLCRPSEIARVVDDFRPNYLVHLAARTDLHGSNIADYEVNFSGTQNLIDAVNRIGGVERILFTSSMLVSGPGHTPRGLEDCKPTTLYGESKVKMERLIHKANLATQWSIVRPTSIWGPWFGEPYRNFFDLVLKGMFIHPGRRACIKTYGFVGNSVRQLESLLTAPAEDVNRRTFYIGDAPPLDISVWADQIRRTYCGRKCWSLPYICAALMASVGDVLKKAGIHFPLTSFRLNNMTTDNVFDLDHLVAVTNVPPVSNEEAIRMTLDWLADH
jgi:nucleoside-diphosphate-sugar epimerase